MNPPRTAGAGAGARAPSNMAAPNAQAVSNAMPQPGAPSPSDLPAIPPELMALLGGGAAPSSPAPPPGAQPEMDPMAMLEALMGMEGAPIGMGDPMAELDAALGPSPMTAMEVGAPEPADPPALPPVPAFSPDFRQQFYARNGRFPGAKDYEDDAFERDFVLRTGRTPTKAEWITRAQPPVEPSGVSEFG